jgi:TonB family protein
MVRRQAGARALATILMLSGGKGFAQDAGGGPPASAERPASAQYDVPPRLIRNWSTSYTIPKHGPKKPPDDNVVLDILIDTKGRVTQARVVKSIPFYDDQAIASVKAWLFSPAMKNGEPVAVRQLTSIHFGKVIDREQVLLWDEQVAPSPAPVKAAEASVSVPVPVAKGPEAEPAAPEISVVAPAAPTPAVLSAAAGDVPRIELLSLETSGADFAGWLAQFGAEVARNWRGPKPADLGPACDGHFEVVVERDGSVPSGRVVKRSANAAFDRAGLKAFFDASFPPLPKAYPSPRATMLVRLSYGESASTTE